MMMMMMMMMMMSNGEVPAPGTAEAGHSG